MITFEKPVIAQIESDIGCKVQVKELAEDIPTDEREHAIYEKGETVSRPCGVFGERGLRFEAEGRRKNRVQKRGKMGLTRGGRRGGERGVNFYGG